MSSSKKLMMAFRDFLYLKYFEAKEMLHYFCGDTTFLKQVLEAKTNLELNVIVNSSLNLTQEKIFALIERCSAKTYSKDIDPSETDYVKNIWKQYELLNYYHELLKKSREEKQAKICLNAFLNKEFKNETNREEAFLKSLKNNGYLLYKRRDDVFSYLDLVANAKIICNNIISIEYDKTLHNKMIESFHELENSFKKKEDKKLQK